MTDLTSQSPRNDLATKSQAVDLTEQMHKGELPYAEYYIKLAGGEYTNDVWDIGGWQSFNKKGDVVVEVLAPVPSYDEWKASYNCMAENEVLRLKNAQLKELLKECKDVIVSHIGKVVPEEVKIKKRKMATKNPVICIETGIVYESIKDCRRKTGIHHIAEACKGIRKIAGGYHWRYYHPDGEKIRDLTKAEQIAWIKQQKEREK